MCKLATLSQPQSNVSPSSVAGGAPPGSSASKWLSSGTWFSAPELVTPLSPPGGILLVWMMVLHLAAPPSSGCSACVKSFVVFWAQD